MSLSEKVLKNIEKHHITPKPKWIFTVQNIAIWFSGLIFLLIGGLAFSVVIYMIIESDWDLYKNLNDSLWEFILLILPYFWLIILGLLVILANYNLKNTKGGYRYRLSTIVAFVLLVSMIIGGVLYIMGIGKIIDETFADRIPIYEKFVNKIKRDQGMWMKPGQGLLAGVIVSVDDGVIKISDFNNDIWVVKSNDQTVFRGMEAKIDRGIKMIGKEFFEMGILPEGEKTFQADFVDILPDSDWLRHHPMGGQRIIEMRTGDADHVLMPSSVIHMEHGDDLAKTKGDCLRKEDCTTPFSFLARSDCPFESECIENNCHIVCVEPLAFKEVKDKTGVQCENDQDCDCSYYIEEDESDCICFHNMCMVLVN